MIKRILVAFLFVLQLTNIASAQYIDPGASSYFFQLMIAGGLAALFYSKQIVRFVRAKLTQLFSKNGK